MADHRNGARSSRGRRMLDAWRQLYKDVHRHPELSMREERTAALAAER